MENLLKVVEAELRLLNHNSNRGPPGASIYKGVCVTRGDKWRSVIYVDGRQLYLGTFESEVEAAKEYDFAARMYFNYPTKLNFPHEGDLRYFYIGA